MYYSPFNSFFSSRPSCFFHLILEGPPIFGGIIHQQQSLSVSSRSLANASVTRWTITLPHLKVKFCHNDSSVMILTTKVDLPLWSLTLNSVFLTFISKVAITSADSSSYCAYSEYSRSINTYCHASFFPVFYLSQNRKLWQHFVFNVSPEWSPFWKKRLLVENKNMIS